jgi:hypothetical protein
MQPLKLISSQQVLGKRKLRVSHSILDISPKENIRQTWWPSGRLSSY